MAQVRKPIPKTPAQAVQESIVPYPEAGYGKSPMVNTDNRANKVSVKGSRNKDFSVKLIDLDTAVLQHIQNNIKPTVYQNTELIDVPVIYAYPERWVAMQNEGFLRDGTGKILTPLIVVHRTDFKKNRNVSRNLDSNWAQNLHVFEKQYTSKNAYDNFNVLNNRKPVKEMMVVAHPDYVDVTYEVNIFTNYVEQLNRVQEAMQYAENSFWGDKNRYYFRVNVDTFPTVNSYADAEERTVSSKLNLTLHGYLIPDTINAYLSHEASYITKGQVVIDEYVVTSDDLFIPALEQNKITPVNPNPTPFDPAALNAITIYLNTNSQARATPVSATAAILYNQTILQAPYPLTPTTKYNFTVFINGVNVDAAYFNLQQVGPDIHFTFDTAGLGFNILTAATGGPDDILVVGKFS